jgi:hypothetical protein
MDTRPEHGRNAAPEDCLLCSEEIDLGADTMIYAGLRVHTDCYWRDVGIVPSRKRDLDSDWGSSSRSRTDDA